jgi:hypothetical protein
MHIKEFYTQQYYYASLKNLIPWRDANPGLLVPEADAMSSAPRRQGYCLKVIVIEVCRAFIWEHRAQVVLIIPLESIF